MSIVWDTEWASPDHITYTTITGELRSADLVEIEGGWWLPVAFGEHKPAYAGPRAMWQFANGKFSKHDLRNYLPSDSLQSSRNSTWIKGVYSGMTAYYQAPEGGWR